jgi:hypothetical protein
MQKPYYLTAFPEKDTSVAPAVAADSAKISPAPNKRMVEGTSNKTCIKEV